MLSTNSREYVWKEIQKLWEKEDWKNLKKIKIDSPQKKS